MCVCLSAHMNMLLHVIAYISNSKNTLWESLLPFHDVELGYWTQVSLGRGAFAYWAISVALKKSYC